MQHTHTHSHTITTLSFEDAENTLNQTTVKLSDDSNQTQQLQRNQQKYYIYTEWKPFRT